ncbi:hypothetical protein MTP10_37250 [Nonomuraea sp. 3-1Str]|uniref:hypothetical protein n=1 Tax=Nonomuraea sp. 3-1Str TaxID=2929801 RepID=UPI00285AF539|nr:hypothetical protein [Nonomuraea sp. 3-1Str]MDR8414365.1 hypothetical protein [Nonomuraea sp. 3-1Str]
MASHDLTELVRWISDLIGDTPLGAPMVMERPGGVQTILIQGRYGLYELVEHPDGPIALHIDAGTRRPLGTYNFVASGPDQAAAGLITQIVEGLEPLDFQVGYLVFDERGVNWKRYVSPAGHVLFKSKRVPAGYVQAEIILDGLVVGLRHHADGRVDQVQELAASRL